MKSFYAPYSGQAPASMIINGHKVIILSEQADCLRDGLHFIGADRVIKIRAGETKAEQDRALSKFSKKVNAGVVLAPNELSVPELIRSLETDLPWLQ
jgi:hypothetical protein